jgi:hypothetical protein
MTMTSCDYTLPPPPLSSLALSFIEEGRLMFLVILLMLSLSPHLNPKNLQPSTHQLIIAQHFPQLPSLTLKFSNVTAIMTESAPA